MDNITIITLSSNPGLRVTFQSYSLSNFLTLCHLLAISEVNTGIPSNKTKLSFKSYGQSTSFPRKCNLQIITNTFFNIIKLRAVAQDSDQYAYKLL